MKLNAGCGQDIREGWLNIDFVDSDGVDEIVDLSEPLPYSDGLFDHIICFDVLEHIWEWEKTLMEFHRVLKIDGILEIKVLKGFRPCAYHLRFFELYSFSPFIAGVVQDDYTCLQTPGNATFKIVKKRIRSFFPLAWHLLHYLKIKAPRYFIIGRRKEIHLVLQKTKETK